MHAALWHSSCAPREGAGRWRVTAGRGRCLPWRCPAHAQRSGVQPSPSYRNLHRPPRLHCRGGGFGAVPLPTALVLPPPVGPSLRGALRGGPVAWALTSARPCTPPPVPPRTFWQVRRTGSSPSSEAGRGPPPPHRGEVVRQRKAARTRGANIAGGFCEQVAISRLKPPFCSQRVACVWARCRLSARQVPWLPRRAFRGCQRPLRRGRVRGRNWFARSVVGLAASPRGRQEHRAARLLPEAFCAYGRRHPMPWSCVGTRALAAWAWPSTGASRLVWLQSWRAANRLPRFLPAVATRFFATINDSCFDDVPSADTVIARFGGPGRGPLARPPPGIRASLGRRSPQRGRERGTRPCPAPSGPLASP